MRDNDYSLPLLSHPAKNPEKLFYLLRSQHGSGFVQNQESCMAIECLQQFHTLLLSN